MRPRFRALASLALVVGGAALPVAPAPAVQLALAGCPRNEPPRVVGLLPGRQLESVAADPRGQGRLFLSDVLGRRILALDAPGAAPSTLVGDVTGPGGLVWLEGEDRLLAGVDNQLLAGPRQAGLVTIDPDDGSVVEVARNLNGANGVAVGPDGSIYTSDFRSSVDRIAPDGEVTLGWRTAASPNGLAVDPTGRHLYVAQTLTAASVLRVDLMDPGPPLPFFRAPLLDAFAGLDGLGIDPQGRIYAAAYSGPGVLRIDPDGSACLLARDPRLLGASMVTPGGGGAFPRTSLFVTTHLGYVLELPNAVR